MSSSDELLVEMLATAREHLRWQRAAVLPDVRKTIEDTLTTTQLRRAFEMCDGTTASADIAKVVGASKASMSEWTRRWRDLGIAYEVEGRRIRHLTSLSALGLSVEIGDATGKTKRRKRTPA
jgi:TnpA family transposase